jgi:hypothetical protein
LLRSSHQGCHDECLPESTRLFGELGRARGLARKGYFLPFLADFFFVDFLAVFFLAAM